MIELSPTLLIAFLGGVAPSLVWLCFWLFEDRCDPEPKRYIFLTYVAGMATVLPVLMIERGIIPYVDPSFALGAVPNPLLLLYWAGIEEIFKFAAAYFVALRSYVFDEPLDAVIYLATAALGFSALENTLFLFGAIESRGALHGIVSADLRFMGATLLHVLASATVGIMLALSFFGSVGTRRLFAFAGLILGIALHTLFNFFILNQGGGATFFVFLAVWFGIVAILSFTEKVKQPARDYC